MDERFKQLVSARSYVFYLTRTECTSMASSVMPRTSITQDTVNQFGDDDGPANADIDDGNADMDARVTRPTEAPPVGVVTASALVDRIIGSLFHC